MPAPWPPSADAPQPPAPGGAASGALPPHLQATQQALPAADPRRPAAGEPFGRPVAGDPGPPARETRVAGPPPRPRQAPDVHLTGGQYAPPVPGDVGGPDPQGDQVAPGWFARSQEPPRMPRGATFADAAVHTPPRGTPRLTPPHGAPQPAWAPIPPAPTPPAPPQAPGDDGRMTRTLVAITAAVVLIAGAVTVVVLHPWQNDKDRATVADTASNAPQPGTPSGPGTSATQPARPSDSLTPTGAPTSAPPTADPAAQATSVSGLLERSGSSRQSVVDAVRNADSCSSLASAVTALSQAADARNTLLRELDALKTDAIPDGATALAQLRTAWQESATADAQYASWAQAQADNGCGAGQSQKTAADAASARATTAKQAFVQAWNPIAARYGLPTRTDLAI
ncbi:hypothetical protein ACPA54_32420 [Uniformispora flossi]|uniref:hypothetical protein n=1 Tax=Uniformispora flossi TaxID=3390723 RepID=UPI003C2CAE73